MRRSVPWLLAGLVVSSLTAQGARADYERAAGVGRLGRLVVPFTTDVRWLPDGGVGWRDEHAADDARFVRVDADGTPRRAATPEALGIEWAPKAATPTRAGARSRAGGAPTTITLQNGFDRSVRLEWIDTDGTAQSYGELASGASREQPTYVGHVWRLAVVDGDEAVAFAAEAGGSIARADAETVRSGRGRRGGGPRGGRGVAERDAGPRAARLFVRDFDLFGTAPDGTEFRLTEDGREDDAYDVPRAWSPDGTKALGFQTVPAERHEVVLIESSPRDQVQPRQVRFDYLKPGDRIAQPRPRLFDVAQRRAIPVEDAPFANAWSIDRVRWADDGHEVYVLYNARGHQRLGIYAIDAATGAVRTVVEERSPTFVDYSQKTWFQWLTGGRELLWASERDGWNHLWHVEVATGALRQITRGAWVVRRVERVDEERQQIWFTAFGLREGQDPYYAHLARIGFDGTGLTVLTEANGTHEWTFSPDGSLFLDRWSRVDQPTVTELRRATDGGLVAELGRDDASALFATGWRAPERFVAKGRDGTTDIHGILIRPSNFDPAKRYPVLEAIYAGPHDFHVPKAWRLSTRERTLAELGFVVVQIDGMGTNWRSRAFHDVCWQNLADAGFPDRIAWLRAAAAEHPELDLSRVGIFGGSAGGQNALGAVLLHGDFYKAAAADCGCHDNRMDKIWWNEAWMGWPVGPEYAANSNVTHAAKLQGALLLTVGELDRNVDPSSTLQVVDALLRADKDFDFVMVPGGGHGVGESPPLARRRMDFFVRHLLGVEPRRS